MIRAILYDCDGVLVNACEWHYEALNRALRDVSGTIIDRDEHKTTFNGLPTKVKLEMLAKLGRVKRDDFDHIWQLKQDYTIDTINDLAKPDPIKEELHRCIADFGIPVACVTNSIRSTAELMLKCTGQWDHMSFMISNEDVVNPKPHGEGYITAMVRLSSPPLSTIIVEDSDKGVQAAASTGAHILRVKDATDVTKDNVLEKIREIIQK